eukprot:CAMPEP_0176029910 /NCGR_PEP_ID=MMETSP0120_2-20121206/14705_1 /TAXON_ID=160619 /ORGANISM="Kryptoperidinium foliaceum, Strain CCMP 1326" /LENGTH=169 /DNA_ID=CAMNT_0017363143 /DNA_START=19 /DNA_END=529 /DNA_ORIENTATION=+
MPTPAAAPAAAPAMPPMATAVGVALLFSIALLSSYMASAVNMDGAEEIMMTPPHGSGDRPSAPCRQAIRHRTGSEETDRSFRQHYEVDTLPGDEAVDFTCSRGHVDGQLRALEILVWNESPDTIRQFDAEEGGVTDLKDGVAIVDHTVHLGVAQLLRLLEREQDKGPLL